MTTLAFVNLPVDDLGRSTAFFEALGYRFNPQFTDEKAGCLVISDTIYAMLMVRPFFGQMFERPVADAHATTSILVCLMVDSKAEVDRLCTAAFAAGGRKYKDTQDLGFMYQWGFEDPDGHVWEVGWMDPTHVMPEGDPA